MFPLHGVLAFSLNLAKAMDMASSRIRYRSVARDRMESRPPICWLVFAGGVAVTPSSRFLRMALAVAIASVVGERGRVFPLVRRIPVFFELIPYNLVHITPFTARGYRRQKTRP